MILQKENSNWLGLEKFKCPLLLPRRPLGPGAGACGKRAPGQQGATRSRRYHVEFLNLTLFSLGRIFFRS